MSRDVKPVCPDCGAEIIWARTEAMKRQMLNPEPDDKGNVHAYEVNGSWLARSVKPGTPAVYPDRLYMPHQATCAGRPVVPLRAPEKPAGNVAFLDAWRTEGARHAKARRRRRARRPVARVAGVRVWPGGRP